MIRMFRQDSSASNESSTSSSDMTDDHDDASSSSTSSLHSNGPLYELSDLMAQLPIKRGLSKFYEGKSESFTCLSSVKSSEELAKKGRSGCHNLKRKMKACNKRYEGRGEEGCLDTEKSCINNITKPTISKKGSRGTSFSSLTLHGRRGCSFFSSTNSLPPVPVYKH